MTAATFRAPYGNVAAVTVFNDWTMPGHAAIPATYTAAVIGGRTRVTVPRLSRLPIFSAGRTRFYFLRRLSYHKVRQENTPMTAAIVSTKGQVVIPARIRTEMGVEAGSRIEFVRTAEGWLIKPATLPVTALKGVLARPRKAVSVEDMNRAIRRRARR
jgi:antitoxin PrlF